MIKTLTNLGATATLSITENKLVRLLNIICLTWYVAILFFALTDYFFEENYFLILSGHLFQFVFLVLVQFLQHQKQYVFARNLFISVSLTEFFVFSNFIIPGTLLEMFYLLIPLFSLLFLRRWFFHVGYLIVSIACFSVPQCYSPQYHDAFFGSPLNIPLLFVAVFLLFYYFKSLNLKNEELLNLQKDQALTDKQIITNQKKELEALQESQNRFFVNVAHEIRTPLTLLTGNSKLIYDSINNAAPAQQEEIKEVEKQHHQIQNIINDVLDLSKISSSNFRFKQEVLDLGDLVSKCASSHVSIFLSKSIRLVYPNPLPVCLVNGSALYLERVLNNLLSNAYKYAPKHSVVTLTLTLEEMECILSVSDQGEGILETDLTKIFERFYQSKNSINQAGGNGVGLAFCKETIQKHKGTISAANRVEGGACLSVRLPLSQGQKPGALAPQKNTLAQPSPVAVAVGKKLLIVEDSLDMQKYLAKILNTYQITMASNGKEALQILETRSFDLIITDYMMPEINGLELVRTLKEHKNNTPIIMLTAKQEHQTKLDVLTLGVDDFITKPFESRELLVRMNNALQNHSSRTTYQQENPPENPEHQQDASLLDMRTFILRHAGNVSFNKSDLCQEFAVSSSSLYRKIKSCAGLSPKDFIKEVKLKEAERQKQDDPSKSLKEIAQELGYINYTYFGKLYETRFGKKIS